MECPIHQNPFSLFLLGWVRGGQRVTDDFRSRPPILRRFRQLRLSGDDSSRAPSRPHYFANYAPTTAGECLCLFLERITNHKKTHAEPHSSRCAAKITTLLLVHQALSAME